MKESTIKKSKISVSECRVPSNTALGKLIKTVSSKRKRRTRDYDDVGYSEYTDSGYSVTPYSDY